jgi:hypothetical protein
MSELSKVIEDMRAASSFRHKLYFASPVLTALAYDIYQRLGLSRLRVAIRSMFGNRPVDRTDEFNERSRERIRALGLGEEIQVLDGPFKGMAYNEFSHGSPLMPKILGVYEEFLHPWLFQALTVGYDCVVNVGSAEGYYAVGFAYTMPTADIYAFDNARVTDELVGRLARLNGLGDRVRKAGYCSPEELQSILVRYKRQLLFVDIEGAEDVLLDIRKAPALARADIIVESHDGYNFGVTRRLIDRLWPTHRYDILVGSEDADRPIPEFVTQRISDPAKARIFVSDFRGQPEQYLRFRSRAASRDEAARV